MALTDAACKAAKGAAKPYKLNDGSGLYLYVSPSGSKLWRQDYAFKGKRQTASFGKYPELPLVQARLKREELKQALRDGRDPSGKEVPPGSVTLRAVAEMWFAASKTRWKPEYSVLLWGRLERDVIEPLGDRAIAGITAPEMLEAMKVIEARGALHMANRMRGVCSKIFRYGIAHGFATFNAAESLGVAMTPLPQATGRAALTEKELPLFFKRLSEYDGDETTVLGLKLAVHTFLRTSEIRFGKWSEIDRGIWIIPAERMKMGREHMVPLSRQVRAILEHLKELSRGSEWILPSRDIRRPISENTLLYALYRMGYHSRATTHGFRATASTILNDSNLFRADVIERALAHVPANQVRAAYNRAVYLPERAELNQWYSDRLDGLETAGLAMRTALDDLL